jgi:hypothetical protein
LISLSSPASPRLATKHNGGPDPALKLATSEPRLANQ